MRSARLLAVIGTAGLLAVAVPAPAQAATASLKIADLSVTETQSLVTKTVAVTRSGVTSTKVTVKVRSANGTAVAPADYAAVPLTTLTFLPGQLTRYVTVRIAGDALDEANETFSLLLSSPVGATLSKYKGTVTIVDNDAPPALTLPTPVLAEGSSGLHDVSLPVSLSAPSGRTVSAAWTLLSGTATVGTDVEPASGTVVFPPGATSRSVLVPLDGDTTDEPDERFYLQVAPVNATATTYNRVTLLDDDAPMVPTLFALVPSTGSSLQVALKGVAQSGTQVQLFANGTCAGGTLTTVAAEALGSGVPVTAAANAVTSWSARSLNAAQEASSCSSAVAYTHDDLAPLAPTGLAFAGGATANDNSPVLVGAAEAGSRVRVFLDACASSPVVTGTATALGNGLALGSVPDDSTTGYWVDLVDAAGNRSTCSPLTYVEDSTAPAPLMDLSFPNGNPGVGTQPVVTGTAEPGTVVDVYATQAPSPQCQPAPLLSVSAADLLAGVRVPFAARTTSVRVFVVRDAAGNTSNPCDQMFGTFYTEQSTETEPNDDRASADVAATGVGVVHEYGEVEPLSDGAPIPTVQGGSDFYEVTVPAEGYVRAETLTAQGGQACETNALNTRLVIWTAGGGIVAQDDDSGPGLCSHALASMLPAGEYYVEVTSPVINGDFPLSYDLRLTVGNAPSAGVTESESNDTSGTANALGAFAGGGQAIEVNGRHGFTSDQDWFSFTLAGSTSVTIDPNDGSGSTCVGVPNLAFNVYQSDGSTKVGGGTAGTDCSSISLGTLSAGTYYVKVSDLFSNSIFGYHFKLH